MWSELAKNVSPATIGSVDNNRIAPVSIERKHLYNNRGMQLLHEFGWKRFRHNENLGVNF
jgi:hypothetical protein